MSAADWTTIDQPQDIRLVVADMDGTLLDEHGRIPEGFWDMLARLRARGVEFVPASGRQYATLRNMFASKASEVLNGGELSYIAENGNVVAVDGKVVEVHGVDLGITRRTIDMVNASVSAGEYDMGLVICGRTGRLRSGRRNHPEARDSRFRQFRADDEQQARSCKERLPGGRLRAALGGHHESGHR